MSEWQETGMHQVNALLSKDADFQGLSKQLTVAQEHYQTAVGKLPPEERKFIEDYITLMEKLLDIMEDDDDVQNVWHNWEE